MDRKPRPRKKGLSALSDTKTNEHHRLPRSHGGHSDARNLSILTIREHDAWHRLFKHFYATTIAEQIDRWHHAHGMRVECRRIAHPRHRNMSGSERVRHERELVTDRPTAVQQEAWEYLFGDLDPPQIVHKINTKYLDPDYVLVLTAH